MNFPSFRASTKLSAATVPNPGILLNGGLTPSFSTMNFFESDLYKSTGKKFNPLS